MIRQIRYVESQASKDGYLVILSCGHTQLVGFTAFFSRTSWPNTLQCQACAMAELIPNTVSECFPESDGA